MEGGGRNHGYKKGLWTAEEDRILTEYIKVHGKGKWNRVTKVTGLKRCGKSCRLRWMNYLSPTVKRGDFSEEENDLIIRLHNLLGNRWSLIAGRVPGRTDNQVKNHWNSHLSKKLGVANNFKGVKSKAKSRSRSHSSSSTTTTSSDQQASSPKEQSNSAELQQQPLPDSNSDGYGEAAAPARHGCDDDHGQEMMISRDIGVGFSGMWFALSSLSPSLSLSLCDSSLGLNSPFLLFFFKARFALLSLSLSNSKAAMDSHTNDANLDGEAHDVDRPDHRGGGEAEDEDYKSSSQPHTGDGASPGKIFIGGLARETTTAQFVKHFGKYGEIIDSVIMKDRKTGQPRGFGFVTYANPSVVDTVIEETHVINGKQVEIKRTIPRGAMGSKDFKTKKIFVGGIPTTVNEDEFSDFFSQFGEVKEHQIMRDHSTGRSRGFGFVTFETEQAVDDLLDKGNKLEFAGAQVEIKKAEPKKQTLPPPPSKRYNDSRPAYGGGYGDSYGGFGGGGYGSAGAYRSTAAAYAGRGSAYGGYNGSEFGGYGVYGGGGGGGGIGAYRGESSVGGYAGRYAGAYSRGYDLGGGGGGYGGTGGESYGGYGSAGGGAGGGYGSGSGYDAGFGGGYGGGGGASFYGSRGGYGGAGSGRYHPYGR